MIRGVVTTWSVETGNGVDLFGSDIKPLMLYSVKTFRPKLEDTFVQFIVRLIQQFDCGIWNLTNTETNAH